MSQGKGLYTYSAQPYQDDLDRYPPIEQAPIQYADYPQANQPSGHFLHPGHVRVNAEVAAFEVETKRFGSNPQLLLCRHCGQQVTTQTNRSPGNWAWGGCLLLCWLSPYTRLPLCCLPFLCRACDKTKHFCSNCRLYLGSS